MLKTFAVSTLLLGSAMAFAQPTAARDRDDHQNNYQNNRDRDRYSRSFDRRDNHERGERREPERFDRRVVPYSGSYHYGYGDRRYGYYDHLGHWCWY